MNTNGKKFNGVVFLQRSRCDFYSTQFGQTLRLEIPTTVMRDLEIIKYDQLVALIKTFIETNKIMPAQLLFVLSDEILFYKDFNHFILNSEDPELQQFLSHIPFDYVTTKTYKLEKGSRVIATNKDIFYLFKKAFAGFGFEVQSVVPSFTLGVSLNFSNGLTPEIAQLFLKKTEQVKQQNLLTTMVVTEQKPKSEGEPKKYNKKRLYIMLGFFGFLILILFIVSYQAFSPVKNAPTTTQPPVVSRPLPTMKQELEITPSTQSAIPRSGISIQILNGSGKSNLALLIKNSLADAGFTDVTTGNASGVTQTKTFIVFNKSVTSEVRIEIINVLKEFFSDVSTQESETNQYKVIVTTGTIVNE